MCVCVCVLEENRKVGARRRRRRLAGEEGPVKCEAWASLSRRLSCLGPGKLLCPESGT